MRVNVNSYCDDIIAGCVSGLTRAIISHPLETLLIERKINFPDIYRNMYHSLQLIYKRQSLIDRFYPGNLHLPLLSPVLIT